MSVYYTESEKAALFTEVVSLIARIDVRRAEIEQMATENEKMFGDVQRASIGNFYRQSITPKESGGIRHLWREKGVDGFCGFPAVLRDVLENPDKYTFDAESVCCMYERMCGYAPGSMFRGESTNKGLDEMCFRCEEALKSEKLHPLLVMTGFLNEFMCHMPFEQNNAEMLEILAYWFLNKNKYDFVRYIQNERKDLEDIFSHMAVSARKLKGKLTWDERYCNLREILFWVEHGQKQVLERAHNYEQRPVLQRKPDLTKKERILGIISASDHPLTKREITDYLLDVSSSMISLELHEFCKEGKIERLGSTRMATYRRVLSESRSGKGEKIERN